MAYTHEMTKPAGDGLHSAESTRGSQYYTPNCDILEQGEELLLRADMPGVKSDQVEVRFEDGVLTIHAKVEPRQAEDHRYLVREYGVGDYFRTFQVSETIDASKISANYADGVLTLRLPKTEAIKPRKIPVKVD